MILEKKLKLFTRLGYRIPSQSRVGSSDVNIQKRFDLNWSGVFFYLII
jgi:hypothetical protein